MPKQAKELGPLDIKRLVQLRGDKPTVYAVGGVAGLNLQVMPSGSAAWLLRVKIGTKRREIGLGGFPSVTLSNARDRARETRDAIRRGIDPVEERKAVKAALSAAQRRGLTFPHAMDSFLDARMDAFHSPKTKAQWRSSLVNYALPALGAMQVADIDVRDVLRALEPIWTTKTETASRVRSRIEAILSWATVAGHRSGDNPARWAGNLKELLPSASKVSQTEHQPAMAIDDAPRWFAALQKRDGLGSRALEFLAQVAARSGEVRGATWDEIDLDKAIWIIPAVRMKMTREHRVPLAPAAVALLRALPRFEGTDLVFPAPRGGSMSDMTLSATMKRIHDADVASGRPGFVDRVSKRPAVPHGLRSTFRDWVAERTHFPGDMAEVALAHKVGNAVEAAYRRGDMIEKRRQMMADWAEFLGTATKASS